MRDHNCHPGQYMEGILSTYLMRDQNRHPPLSNTLMGIVTKTYFRKGSKLPPSLANILNRILTWTSLHEGSKLPPPLANIYMEQDLNFNLSSWRITIEELSGWRKIHISVLWLYLDSFPILGFHMPNNSFRIQFPVSKYHFLVWNTIPSFRIQGF